MHLDADSILATVRDLVALAPRATGTPGGRAAAAYVEGRLADAGLRTDLLEVPSYAWRAEECRLSVDGEPLDCAPVLHSALTAHDAVGPLGGTVRGRVVDIGADAAALRRPGGPDARGAVVLFDLTFDMALWSLLPVTEWFHDPGRRVLRREVMGSRNPYVTSLTRVVRAAREAGAAAVVGVLRDYPESVRYHNEYYRRHLLDLPGAWVTAATGRRLRARLRPGSTAELVLRAQRDEVTSQTVLGLLPGRSRETVMLQSHHDSVGPGAVEDATGTAEVVALAEHLAARVRAGWRPRKNVLVTTFDTHFTGYQAHQEFTRRYVLDPTSPYDVVLNLTVEHVGRRARRGADGDFETLAETEPRGLFENLNPWWKVQLVRALRRHGMHSTSLLNATPFELSRAGIPTDASFTLVAGVPTVSLISGPLYLYDDADTLDKVDVAQLEPVARFFADLLDRADRAPGQRIGLVPARLRRRLPRGRW
ncbi:M28 family peptidase [Nocardioides zeae]